MTNAKNGDGPGRIARYTRRSTGNESGRASIGEQKRALRVQAKKQGFEVLQDEERGDESRGEE